MSRITQPSSQQKGGYRRTEPYAGNAQKRRASHLVYVHGLLHRGEILFQRQRGQLVHGALHKDRDVIKKSLYQLFELFSQYRSFPDLQIAFKDIQSKGQDYYLKAIRLLEQYVEYIPSIGLDYRKNAWYGFRPEEINFDALRLLKSDLEVLTRGYRTLQETTVRIKSKYETPELNLVETRRWQSLLSFSARSDVITPSLLSKEAYDYALPYLKRMQELSERIAEAKDAILVDYSPDVIQAVNGNDTYAKLAGQFRSAVTRLFSVEYKNLIASLLPYERNGKKLSYKMAINLAEKLMKLQSASVAFSENENAVLGCLGPCYNGSDTDWQHVMSELDTLRGYFADNESFGSLPRLSQDGFTAEKEGFRADADELESAIQGIEESRSRLAKQFSAEALDLDNCSYGECLDKLDGCLSDFDKLVNWRSFEHLLGQIREADLASFVDLVIEKHVAPEQIIGAYRRVFLRQWIEYIIFSDPVLASFTRIKQDQAVLTFVDKDRKQYEISKLQIKAELSQQRPNLEMVAGGSAVAILRREGQKKRKQMPIRKLLSETGSLVQLLKPCFLMSPLSVSTFLDPEKISFDTVIFDEASQIFPQDAIGAIYRGKQLIVVGDSKQMPPSNFFNASSDIDDDDEEIGDINDFESILDICSSVFSTERLSWHYRSHYEQLIAFSNLNFYNNGLVTFPSASTDQKGIGVDYYYVDGVFDRKSKTNREEAEFIVELIYRNIETFPKRSLGVVAFSVAQQNLIDKLLSKRREEDPSYEWFFRNDSKEPFFVKNLETVQGDERDTIIFSVAYAKDSQGRFIHNFGPLNRERGERRLNVAVTRAKDNVQLVASIHYTDINLQNSGSEGVRLLRAYLDYAENGEQALERAVTVSENDHFDSYFEQEVCDFLRDHGFTVDTQVGCSGYRIDLGLRKPDSSDYLLAIECDGATYHRSRNARDRDSLRQSVLENMGWQFYRIWSTDWFRNKTVEKEKLLQAAKDAVAKDNKPDEQAAEVPSETEEVAEEIEEKYLTELQGSSFEFPKYAQLDAIRVFQKHQYSFQSAIREILDTEAPLSENYLLKRIISIYGREKVTKVVVQDYERRMYRCEQIGIIRRNGFLYLQGKTEIKFRVPGDRREIKYIAPEEIADGLYALIRQNVTASREGLYKTMTNLLGFSRTGEAIEAKYDEALQMLKRHELVTEEDGMLSLR